MDLKIVIHGVGKRRCSMSRKKGKEPTDGVLVTFEGSAFQRKFLSFGALSDMINAHAAQLPEESVPAHANGEVRDE